MLLKDKTAIIYGGGGAVGGAIAQAFAREGARIFLAGRTLQNLENVKAKILAEGNFAQADIVDALYKDSVATHLATIMKQEGRLDIVFNAIALNDVQGKPLTALSYEDFSMPVMIAMKSYFIIATEAVKHMQKRKSGVILGITANVARRPCVDSGGFGVACASIEAFSRQLAIENGHRGIRCIVLRSAGSPDAPGVDAVFNDHAQNAGVTREVFEKEFVQRTMLKRLPKLDEVARAATLAASDHASAITAAVLNVTCGELAD